MQISFIWVGLFNFVVIAMISYFGMKLIIKAFENFAIEIDLKKSEADHRRYGTFDIFMDNLNLVRRKFWASFFFLEFALISYFLFWGVMFYSKAIIVW